MKIWDSLHRQAGILTRSLGRLLGAKGGNARLRPMGGRARGLFARGEEGGALVEIALVTPALLGLLTGIIAFGLAYSNQLTLTQATGTAGQYLAQIRTSTTDPCADVFTALKNAAPGLSAAKISVTVTMNGTTPTQTGATCSGAQTDLVAGKPVTVYATYPCTLSIYNSTLTSGCSLAAKVTEYEY